MWIRPAPAQRPGSVLLALRPLGAGPCLAALPPPPGSPLRGLLRRLAL